MKTQMNVPETRGTSKLVFIFMCIAGLSLVASISFGILHFTNSKKIGYVKSNELVYEYVGMKEAQVAFKEKLKVMQANADTLASEFQRNLNLYNAEYSQLSGEERQKREALLGKQEENVTQYRHVVEEKARNEEQEMTEGVLNQINSFIEEYGKNHGYDLILGTTGSGSILYGEDAIDITKDLLQELNQSYKKTPATTSSN